MFRGKEFELHGVVLTEENISDSEFFNKFFKMLEDNGMTYCGTYYQLDENGNYTSDLTFLDLYSYIQTAERDNVGIHHIKGMSPYSLHIYNNKLQVNLCKDGNPIADFVFSSNPEEVLKVKLVKVDSNMVADYDNPTEIDAIECIQQENAWYSKNLGSNGVIVRNVLLDILTPVKVQQIKRTQENIDRATKALNGE